MNDQDRLALLQDYEVKFSRMMICKACNETGCDHPNYTKPCEVCQGVGRIPFPNEEQRDAHDARAIAAKIVGDAIKHGAYGYGANQTDPGMLGAKAAKSANAIVKGLPIPPLVLELDLKKTA